MVRDTLIPGYNRSMRLRWGWLVLTVAVFSTVARAADQTQSLLTLSCAQAVSGAAGCDPSKVDLRKANSAFSKALKLQKAKRFDQAFEEFDTAARLVPRNIEYLTALALVRQQLVFDHLQQGNADLLKGKQVEAQAEFRTALNLDPENEFARQRMLEALGTEAPRSSESPRLVEDSGVLRVVPKQALGQFHFSGDARALLTEVAAAFDVTADFDDSVVSRRVRFDIDPVDFYGAMRAACAVTGTFWTPLTEKHILVARDTPENHRQLDRMAMRTFYLPGATTPQDFNEITGLLRILFDIRFFGQQAQNGTVEVRAPVPVLDAATRVLESFGRSRPQVMLDVQVFEINHQLTRNMGVHIPNDFTLFNIPAAALAALGGQNIQDLINQLISGGGINQANSQAISGLLAQLQGQQNSIFSQPVATFGNGTTLMGVSLGTLSGELSLNESWVKNLQHAILRASQNTETNFRMGSRYPILNASFAPVFNSPAIAQVLQNNSFQAPFPSFSYEDLGLTIKAKPAVNAGSAVSLGLEIELRTLAGQSLNGVPVIANRQYKGSITLVDGEPAVVAGSVTRSEQLSLNGIPGLGSIPGLNKIAATNGKTDETDELLVVITPHVLDSIENQSTEVWLPKSGQ